MIYELRVFRVSAGPHGGPADTAFEHQTLPIMVRHCFLQAGFWTDNRWPLGTTHLSACMGVACTAPRTVGCV